MLELINVHAGYGRTAVSHGICLTVGAGEIVSLIGSNGAGKSTTLRTISAMLAVRDGKIQYKGTQLRTDPGAWCAPEFRKFRRDLGSSPT